MKRIQKIPLPEDIARKMADYRLKGWGVPTDYIIFHLKLAHASMQQLAVNHQIKASFIEPDGWMDRMLVLNVLVRREGKYSLLQWHSGNQWWMKLSPYGGWSIYTTPEMYLPKVIEADPHVNWSAIYPVLEHLSNGHPIRIEDFWIKFHDLQHTDYLVLGEFLCLQGKFINARSTEVIRSALSNISLE
jgi:hypothetical protein